MVLHTNEMFNLQWVKQRKSTKFDTKFKNLIFFGLFLTKNRK